MTARIATLVAGLCAAGCAHPRSPDMYRDDTATLFATKNVAIRSCYDTLLRTTPTASGRVAVKFAVEKDTGKIVDPKLDGSTTAPEPLSQCVLSNLASLVITPADAHRGQATWVWDFTAGPPKT